MRVISPSIVAEKHIVCRSFGKNRDYALDRGKETHVQHTIRFIEDEHAQRVKVEESTVEVILSRPGVATTSLAPLRIALQLRAFGQSAND